MPGRSLGRLAAVNRCLLVSGLPCAGNSTLARFVAARYGWPLLSKDDYKERIFGELGASDRAWSRRVSALAWTLLFDEAARHLAAGQTCVLEGNFREPEAAAARAFRPLARLLELHCVADPKVLLERYRARAADGTRHPGHVDLEALPELEAELGRAAVSVLLAGPDRLEWDTSGGVDALALVPAIERLLGPPSGAGAQRGR